MLELVINEEENKKSIMLVENGILIEKHEENKNQKRIEGNIYVGFVQNVLPGMQAAFINVGESKNTFIKLKDVLPKIDESAENNSEIAKKINITELISNGQKIMVQVRRDGALSKGAKVSTHINIPGRYIALMPHTDFITISQKIDDDNEASRLIQILKEKLPEGYGAVIRTAANGIDSEKIEADVDKLIKKWNDIENAYEKYNKNEPCLLYDNRALLRRTIMDIVDKGLNKIVVNDKNDIEIVRNILQDFKIENDIPIELDEKNEIIAKLNIESQVKKMEDRKIWLKCGGFITIDKTEALTAIDVNSGKYTGNKNVQETIFKVNKEATMEIAKQLRLRDIGGIIIIDYIDMEISKQNEILTLFEECLKKDRTKTQIMGFTKLNLLEMTRKKLCNNEEF